MTLLVRNEEDVLDVHLRYHLAQGVDFFVVTDNRSEDATRSILERYVERGVAHVIDEPDDDYAQSRWVTRMARLATDEFGADWVVHADADEFFLARQGRLCDALGCVPEEFGIVRMPRLNFRPRPEDGAPFHQRLVVRETRAVNALGQPLPPKVCHRASRGVEVRMGNHDVCGTDLRRLPGDPLLIFHYPLRSYGQFERKIRLGGAAIARNPELALGAGRTWRRLHELLAQGRLREFYDAQVVDDRSLAQGLRAGELLVDRRLACRIARPHG